MSPAWFQEILRWLGMLLGLLFIGLFFGQTFLFLFLICLMYLGWHLYNLYRLEYWFTHSKKFHPPEAPSLNLISPSNPTTRMCNIVDDLLLLSRLESKSTTKSLEIVTSESTIENIEQPIPVVQILQTIDFQKNQSHQS